MTHNKLSWIILLSALGLATGCSSYQPTKDVWKGTKNLWYTYASPPASVNYEEKGNLSVGDLRLSQSMIGIDKELEKFQRVMLNADRPPTNEWIANFLVNFPWMNGIAGVKYDGTILGQEPATSLKELDYIPLLYEDKKQRRTALRGDVQNTPLGPEVLLAAPLYESAEFLGIVVAHFDMRSLATFSQDADRLVILSPQALLWPGGYDFAQTPLAGQDWAKICRESTQGVCTNSHGKFIYQVRYIGNLPLVFAVAEADTFPKGNGSVDQGKAYFPEKREKLPPPPQPERKERKEKGIPIFGGDAGTTPPELSTPGAEEEPTPVHTPEKEQVEEKRPKTPLTSKPRPERRRTRVQERSLEGENVRIEPITRRERRPVQVKPDLNLPSTEVPTLPGGRPSPFGAPTPKPEKPSTSTPATTTTPPQDMLPGGRPSPFGTHKTTPAPETTPAAPQPPKSQEPATLPGGRPSPFGS
ncbi:MAG: hypothetical protein IJU79_04040 [Desulfovibrionaceae bacterium]|nr:hypothetical protein [Desulfovibrionaceae bacterium]